VFFGFVICILEEKNFWKNVYRLRKRKKKREDDEK